MQTNIGSPEHRALMAAWFVITEPRLSDMDVNDRVRRELTRGALTIAKDPTEAYRDISRQWDRRVREVQTEMYTAARRAQTELKEQRVADVLASAPNTPLVVVQSQVIRGLPRYPEMADFREAALEKVAGEPGYAHAAKALGIEDTLPVPAQRAAARARGELSVERTTSRTASRGARGAKAMRGLDVVEGLVRTFRDLLDDHESPASEILAMAQERKGELRELVRSLRAFEARPNTTTRAAVRGADRDVRHGRREAPKPTPPPVPAAKATPPAKPNGKPTNGKVRK